MILIPCFGFHVTGYVLQWRNGTHKILHYIDYYYTSYTVEICAYPKAKKKKKFFVTADKALHLHLPPTDV